MNQLSLTSLVRCQESGIGELNYFEGIPGSIQHTTSTTQSKRENSMCLKDHELKANIDNYGQIFVVMPPKAGGTSMNGFARRCLGNTALFQNEIRSRSSTNLREKWLPQSYDNPNLLVGHIFSGESMESLLKGVSKDTLIVYIHREETSRLASAIKQVMGVQCEGQASPFSCRQFSICAKK